MEPLIARLLFQNWQRKGVALLTAVVVWIFVNQSITDTKTISNVPIRVINLPNDKTIIGLLPNGYLSQRATLALGGSRDIIQELEQGDFEVLLDASTAENDDWVAQITKKNLVSLNPAIDLRHHIKYVTHPEFVITLSQLVTEKVPIFVKKPIGNPPQGYEFLNIWPERLTQTISGPIEEIRNLKVKGLRLTLDLNKITKAELDDLKHSKKPGHDDEISFPVPERNKQVSIPFRNNIAVEINGPEAKNLRIDFLRKRLLPIGKEVPIIVYYPLKYSDTINPDTHVLAESDEVHIRNGIFLFKQPLFVRDVSQLFLDIIRENIEIVIVAAPTSERLVLQWSLEVIDPREMEDTYVAFVMAEQKEAGIHASDLRSREEILRRRFHEYMQKLLLYTASGEKLNLISTFENNKIIVHSE
ncbi:MAG: YbbR-like domain-containing protein [Waddliaceae bacterium]